MAGQATPGVQQGARGFVGITWSLQDNRKTYDCFYLRPTNESANDQERRNHSVQYISHPEWTWYRDAPLAGHPIMELGSGLIEGRMIVERGFYSCRFYAIINATRVSDDCEQMAIGGGLLTICQGQKSYKKGQLLPVDLARLNQGKNPSHSQNGS